MRYAEWLNGARRAAGLTQRELAERSGIPQPTIARIESGRQIPRADTLDRLLRACGFQLDAAIQVGAGVDRSQIEEYVRLTPRQRVDRAVGWARALDRVGRARRVS